MKFSNQKYSIIYNFHYQIKLFGRLFLSFLHHVKSSEYPLQYFTRRMRKNRNQKSNIHIIWDTWPLPWSPYICDVFYPLDIRQATGDKARLNPPNQLCFTVPATLPLYITYRSPYIFARSTCVQRCRRLHIHIHTHAHTHTTCVFAIVRVRTLSPGISARVCKM